MGVSYSTTVYNIHADYTTIGFYLLVKLSMCVACMGMSEVHTGRACPAAGRARTKSRAPHVIRTTTSFLFCAKERGPGFSFSPEVIRRQDDREKTQKVSGDCRSTGRERRRDSRTETGPLETIGDPHTCSDFISTSSFPRRILVL